MSMHDPQQNSDAGVTWFRALFNEANTGVCLLGDGGQYVAANPAYNRLLGIDEAALRELGALDTTHSEDLAPWREALGRLFARESRHEVLNSRFVRPGGGPFWARARLSAVNLDDNKPDYVLLMADVSLGPDRAVEEEFLSQMSHELRTPLNAIMGFSDMISGEILGPLGNDRYRHYAADINASGRNLLSMIDMLLDRRSG